MCASRLSSILYYIMCSLSFVQSEASLSGTWSAAEARSEWQRVLEQYAWSHERRSRDVCEPLLLETLSYSSDSSDADKSEARAHRTESERACVPGAAAACEEEEEEEDGQTGGGRGGGDRWAETHSLSTGICLKIMNIVKIIWPNITLMNASLLIKTRLTEEGLYIDE